MPSFFVFFLSLPHFRKHSLFPNSQSLHLPSRRVPGALQSGFTTKRLRPIAAGAVFQIDLALRPPARKFREKRGKKVVRGTAREVREREERRKRQIETEEKRGKKGATHGVILARSVRPILIKCGDFGSCRTEARTVRRRDSRTKVERKSTGNCLFYLTSGI